MVAKKKKQVKKKIWRKIEVRIPLEEGIEANYEEGILTLKGPKGDVSKKLRYPGVKFEISSDVIIISCDRASQSEKKIIFTYRAHLRNMIKGVTEGFTYKLKVVYSKFPITVEFKDNKLMVKNFLGEKISRNLVIPEDVKVEVKGQDITVSSIDKEKAGQVAANIEQLTRISHLDRRVIQDGVYIVEKPHNVYV